MQEDAFGYPGDMLLTISFLQQLKHSSAQEGAPLFRLASTSFGLVLF